MPLIDQHQAEYLGRRRELEKAALGVEQTAGGFNSQADSIRAQSVQPFNQRCYLAAMLVDQVDAWCRQNDVQFIKCPQPGVKIAAAQMSDVLQDVQVHEQRLTAACRHPIGQHVPAHEIRCTGALFAQNPFGEVKGKNLVIAQPHRLGHELGVFLQP